MTEQGSRFEDKLPRFKLDEAIHISPNFDLVDVLGQDCSSIYIEGVGIAQIIVKNHYPDWDSQEISGFTPAGPVEAKVIIEEGQENLIISPIKINILVLGLDEDELRTLKCEINYNDRMFTGLPSYDSVPLKKTGRSDLLFSTWFKPSEYDGVSEDIFFPRKSEVFEQLEITFKRGLLPELQG